MNLYLESPVCYYKYNSTTFCFGKRKSHSFFSYQRCRVPEHLAGNIRVTSWLHEEGTAIEIFPEREPRGKYTLLQTGDLLVHHTSTYDTYKKYVCKTEHTLSGIRRRSLVPARLTLKGSLLALTRWTTNEWTLKTQVSPFWTKHFMSSY